MSNENSPESQSTTTEPTESFDAILSDFEKTRKRKAGEAGKQLEGTVITVTADSVVLDIGFKSEGILPLTAFQAGENVKPGDKLAVSVKGRDPEGYYELTRFRTEQPRTRPSRRKAAAKAASDNPLDAAAEALWQALRTWRLEEARRQELPPYVIFHDATLIEVARRRPNSPDALADIPGIGRSKLDRYGEALLSVIAGT